MSKSLTSLLSRRAVHALADPGSLERGIEYVARGRVRGLSHDDALVVAEVVGSRFYRVRLWAENDELQHACTCPIGEEGRFCKHCVAVGLAWIGARATAAKGQPTLADLRTHLAAQTKEALVELLMEQATADEHVRRRLLLETVRKSGSGTGPGSARAR